MLKLSEYSAVDLPKYVIWEELSKKNLRQICLDNPELKLYLPDSPNFACIERQFYISVNLIFHIS
jgi:hypothetical protein